MTTNKPPHPAGLAIDGIVAKVLSFTRGGRNATRPNAAENKELPSYRKTIHQASGCLVKVSYNLQS